MNVYELAVLDAVNIASTRYRNARKDRYQATVGEIIEILRTDERMASYGAVARIGEQAVANYLSRLRGSRGAWRSFGPLVQKVGTKHGKTVWALTDTGARVLGA